LKNKLAEKTKGAQSEESVLKKAFKYFDLNDNGTVEPEEFAKAIEKIGIQIPTKQVSSNPFLAIAAPSLRIRG
jgi:Ca2+-binding EF-hand superfamily protein